MKLRALFEEVLNTIEIPDIPNCRNFWHGGNLDDYDEVISQKKGRQDYGPGLYLTTHHEVASRYAKGGRKLYIVTVENGMDLDDAELLFDNVEKFINKYVVSNRRWVFFDHLDEYVTDEGTVKASYVHNILLNNDFILNSRLKQLRIFYIENGIDYYILNNQFGWGENTMVLFNMKKIKNTIVFKPTDRLEEWNFKTTK